MDNHTFLTSLFGWCSVLNIGFLVFATLFLVFFSGYTKSTHSKLFNVPENELDVIYFKYLAYYKIGILLFNLTPYIALKIGTV